VLGEHHQALVDAGVPLAEQLGPVAEEQADVGGVLDIAAQAAGDVQLVPLKDLLPGTHLKDGGEGELCSVDGICDSNGSNNIMMAICYFNVVLMCIELI